MINFLSRLSLAFQRARPSSENKRKSTKHNDQLCYETLEPRQLLAGGGIASGTYGNASHCLVLTSIAGQTTAQNEYVVNLDSTGPNQTISFIGYVERPGANFPHGSESNLGIDILDTGGAPIGVPGGVPADGTSFVLSADQTRVNFVLQLTASNQPSAMVPIPAGPGLHQLSFVAYATGFGNDPVAGLTVDLFVNRNPVAVTADLATNEDVTLSGTLVATDVDAGDTLTFSLVTNVPANGNGTVTIAPNGAFTYTPETDDAGNAAFTYRVTDEHGAFDEQQVAITVNPVNDGPRWSSPISQQAAPGSGPVFIDPASGVIDPEGNPIGVNTLEISASPGSGFGAVPLDLGDGDIAELENGMIKFTPVSGISKTFFYRVKDNPGGTLPAEFLTNLVVPVPGGVPRPITITLIQRPEFAGYTDDVKFIQGDIPVSASGTTFNRPVTNDPSPVFRGTAEEGTTVTLLGLPAEAVVNPASLVVPASGIWEFQIGIDTNDDGIPDSGLIADGSYLISVEGDKNGIIAVSQEFDFSVDTGKPTAPSDIRISTDTQPGIPASDAPASHANFDSDGVTRNPGNFSELEGLIFSQSVESGPVSSGIDRYQIRVNNGNFENVGNDEINLSIGEAIFDLRSIYENNTTAKLVFRAFDMAGNLSSVSQRFWATFDTTKPTIADFQFSTDFQNSTVLPTPVITTQRPEVSVTVTDQQFRVGNNQLTFRLYVDGVPDRLVTRTIAHSGNNSNNHTPSDPLQLTLRPIAPLAIIQTHNLFVRVFDRAGNKIDSGTVAFFVAGESQQTLSAPGTPISTNLYYLGARSIESVSRSSRTIKVDQAVPLGVSVFIDGQYGGRGNLVIESRPVNGGHELTLERPLFGGSQVTGTLAAGEKVAWLRPWQMTFDNTTQTVWFTTEDGHGLGQFDPATGHTRIWDVSMPLLDTQGNLVLDSNQLPQRTAIDPHGAIFDFNSHLTPRVWIVHRNDGGRMPMTENGDGTPLQVSWFDVTEEKLFTLNLTSRFSGLGNSHAIFVDGTGDVWLTGDDEDGGVIVQLDFGSDPGSSTGQAVVHRSPDGLTADGTGHLDIHGLDVIVDERTGTQYVYFVDAVNDPSLDGRSNTVVGLLYPRNNSSLVANPQDQWFTWTVPVFEEEETTAETAQPLFAEVDDRETPGIPEDDLVVVSDPGFRSGAAKGKGIIAGIEVGQVIEKIQSGMDVPVNFHSPARYVEVPAIAGVEAGIENAGNVQVVIDRSGTIFAFDTQGALTRFHLDSAEGLQHVDARVRTAVSTVPNSDIDSITFSEAPIFEAFGLTLIAGAETELSGRRPGNLSTIDGIDQYEVGAVRERGNGDQVNGAFRGTANATNVVFGSISQSDYISTSVFAETARRQLAVVQSPQTPSGLVEGRMAFQVSRNGNLLLTGRVDGQLLDIQRNITQLIADKSSLVEPEQLAISGEVSAVVDEFGRVHVAGKLQSPDGQIRIISFVYLGRWDSQVDLVNPDNWGYQILNAAPGNGVLTGDPTAFYDENVGNVRILISTNTGQLLLYQLRQPDPIVLGNNSSIHVYSGVGVVQQGNWNLAYGTDQQGELIEYGFNEDLSVNYSRRIEYALGSGTAERDVRVFQDVKAVVIGHQRHVYATDGNSRLVHVVIDPVANLAWAENVSKIVNDQFNLSNVADAGYFPFQSDFVGRVYSGLEVLANDDGDQFVYGTNGSELVLFIKRINQPWSVANLTNDIYSVNGPNRGGPGQAPRERVPANSVFGSPGGYINENGDRHLFQINKEGEVVEYFILNDGNIPRFHSQNITLRILATS